MFLLAPVIYLCMHAALGVHQTLDLQLYVSPGVYSDGSPVIWYGDGVICGLPCPDALAVSVGHAGPGAPLGRPCTIDAKATTAVNISRAVFMAYRFYNPQDDRVQHFFQHKLLNMLCLQLHVIYISVNGMRLLYKQVWPGQTISCSHMLHNAYLPHQSSHTIEHATKCTLSETVSAPHIKSTRAQ